MEAKARILIEFGGKTYRVGKSSKCASKRDCDLFKRGLCDSSSKNNSNLPCDAIEDAFIEVCEDCPQNCFKEVKRK